MRLLSIVHGPVWGGGNNQVARLAEPLARRGWETQAAVPDVPEVTETLARLRTAGVPTGTLPLHRLRRTANPRVQVEFMRSFRREVGVLRGLIRRTGVDLVQVFGETNPHLAIAGHLEGRAVVWHLYDLANPRIGRQLTMPLVRNLADVVMTTGRELARHFPGTGRMGERCVAVYPPVDPDEWRPDPARRDAARRELGVPDGVMLVGAVGNRNPTKRHDVLVEAMAALGERFPDVWCRILGARSPSHEHHMAEVDQAVARTGLGERLTISEPGSRVLELMPAFDVFAMPSESDGMPTVILEAMALEIPIVSTDVGAIREVVEDGPCGLIVPPLDPAALAGALSQVIERPELRAAFGRQGRQRVVEKYATERCADLYAQAYGLAVRHRGSRRA